MAGENDELDIIDAAMSGDDTDYGDKTTIEQDEQKAAEIGSQEPKTVDTQQTPTPEQSIQQQPTQQNVPGRVPAVDPKLPEGWKKVGAQYADGKGNIVDRDGKIIAPAGASARFWQEASRATAQAANYRRQLETLQRENQSNQELLARAKEVAELPQRLGVTPEDYNEGVTLMAQWRKNPVEVAREVVARTLTFGYNVSDILGKTAGDALEMKALVRMQNEATAPLRAQQEQTQQQAAHMEAATKAYNKFTSDYPDAEMHGEAIASLMQRRNIPAEVAYFQVKTFALENGLDFTQPLGPQIEARQRQPVPDQRPTVQRAPMVNGGRGSEQSSQQQPRMASADSGWGDILNEVMREQ